MPRSSAAVRRTPSGSSRSCWRRRRPRTRSCRSRSPRWRWPRGGTGSNATSSSTASRAWCIRASRSSMPWPRAAVRRGSVTIGAKVATVALETLECLGDTIRLSFASDDEPTELSLSVDGRPHPILEIGFDPESGRGSLIGYPVLRGDEQLSIELPGESPVDGRPALGVSVAARRVALCGAERSTPSIRVGVPGAARAPGRSAIAACRDLRPLAPPWCERCGSPSILPVPACGDCPPPPLDSTRAAFVFEGPARRAIHRLKFSGWRDVAAAMADAMAAVGPPAAADVVTWVPLARGRRAERGYDQARALAVALAHRLDLPAVRLLRRPVATGPQARRSGEERRAAMHGAFRAVRPVPQRVLVVDDVLTTGRHARGRRRGASRRRGARGPRRGGRAFLAGQGLVAGRRAVGLSSGGLTFGSVVARGCSPVVDASRGRNDPRKATVGG